MKNIKKIIATCLVTLALSSGLCACSTQTLPGNEPVAPGFVNPGDSLGGGGVVDSIPEITPTETDSSVMDAVGDVSTGGDAPEDAATSGGGKISAAGDYVITGNVTKKINVKAEGVHLFLDGANISVENDKAISSDYDLTITLIGENTVGNTGDDIKNAIGCDGNLVINGSGSLSVTSLKNGISANTISVKGSTITVNAQKDGLHAEIGAYDDLTTAPEFNYDDGGFIYLDGAKLDVTSVDDGIQADTFVVVTGDSDITVKAGGGAPNTVTETSSDNASGKGIKVGLIDWGADGAELANGDYLLLVESGNININSNDDSLHSNGNVSIKGGKINVATGDDGVHADGLLSVSGGEICVTKSYEGVEGAKVEVSGGKISVVSVDDGINAADGTESRPGQANSNCHMIISGGEVYVNAQGDGLDSNGTMLISGGLLSIAGPTNGGNAALDSDGGIVVNGGYLFAVGALGMVETPASNSAQNVVSYAHGSVIAAGTVISLCDADGNPIFYFDAPKACQSVIISCPELKTGSGYKIYGGDTELCSFTISSTITTVGSSGGMSNPGGRPGTGGMGGWPGR